MIEANLLRSQARRGSCINFKGAVCRVIEHLGQLDCFPGGRGVSTMLLQPLPAIKFPATKAELAKLDQPA